MQPRRVLCLHGKGTSGNIFKSQSASFRQLLQDQDIEFHFVDAPLLSSAAAGIDLFYEPPYYSFWEGDNINDIETARDWLDDLISREGPFDGLMMFSQGCILGASVLLRHQKDKPQLPPPFEFAIFICGGAPLKELRDLGFSIDQAVWERDLTSKYELNRKAASITLLAEGSGRWTEVDQSISDDSLAREITGPYQIKVPTVHVIGSKDPRFNAGRQLANLCDAQSRKTYDHEGGHEIPRNQNVSKTISDLVRWAVRPR